ncbi:MAG TPA: sensor histidine kinase [Solirubrobacteraceae bacterium]|jgi:signal transduction histidine kinase|nr:sensor histidine kinase [Solirubrobacteraceae bacterium]
MLVRLSGVHLLGRLVSAPSERRSPARRLRGYAVAIAGPAAVTAVALPFRSHLGLAGFLLFTLIVVLAVALRSGFLPSLVSVIAGVLLGGYFFITPYDSLRVYLRVSDVPLIAYLIVGAVLGLLVDELARIAGEQRELRSQVAASRVRIVAAADEARRRIERDLHDGAQQRIVALTLGLKTAQMAVPTDLSELSQELSTIAAGLSGVTDDLREMARGIHPSILAEGGIVPALRTLARRSVVPVDLELDVDGRLPEQIEVAAYYVVSESLTNIAKHAQASRARLSATSGANELRLLVSDDGRGGADSTAGSGLIGLRDRVEALGGSMSISSPAGAGTAIEAVFPRRTEAGSTSPVSESDSGAGGPLRGAS